MASKLCAALAEVGSGDGEEVRFVGRWKLELVIFEILPGDTGVTTVFWETESISGIRTGRSRVESGNSTGRSDVN